MIFYLNGNDMKNLMKFILPVLFVLAGLSCSGDDYEEPCGFHNGKQLYLGPKGGCYYYNSNNNKEYVARSECKC